jgi:BirA family transcriptional regulator, biotin operon repressor / biotin---[acetyl-CoA-carboxylase] ligase
VTRSRSGGELSTGSTGEQILSLLRGQKKAHISGEAISQALNISRSAVWKQISSLRASGYKISAEPSKGYTLDASPDTLNPSEIRLGMKSRLVGRRILSLPEAVSTNASAFRLAEEGAEEGTTLIADFQSGGKGRLGRVWASPQGVNLYCSIILRPPIKPVAAPQLTFLSVVAVARTIERLTDLKPRIKWPNDILVEGRKVAGLLNEMSAETDKVNFVVLGIGVNINMQAEQFPADLRHPATSLFIETGKTVNRTAFTRVLLEELDDLYLEFIKEGYAPVRKEWLEKSRLEGAVVTVTDNGSSRSGRVRGIDEYGALILETGEQILSGDVVIGG